jgi:hypothetical protein
VKNNTYICSVRKLYYILTLFLLSSCEKFALERSDVTLSGKYVVSKMDITNVDQNTSRDSLYTLGSTYINPILPDPFDSIEINRFYWHMDYSTIRLNELGVTPTGKDIWEYGNSPNEIFYTVLGNTTYSSGYLQFDYLTKDGSTRRMTFFIEDDNIESLQLKSAGSWFKGKFGEKQVMTLYLTRVGP